MKRYAISSLTLIALAALALSNWPHAQAQAPEPGVVEAEPDSAAEVDRAQIEKWIEDLGSLKFADRIKAETNLRDAGRPAMAALRDATRSSDPQIRHSAIRILDHLMLNPDNIPTVFRSLVPGERNDYRKADDEWRKGEGVKSAASNTDGRAGTSGHFAQSFVPKCDTISAIEVCTYPLSGAHGWLRLDLCKDDDGKPAKPVVARSWVYAPKGHGFPHSSYIVHDFGGVPVDPEEKLWMVSVTYQDPDCEQHLINYGLSFQKDDYPDGKLWRVSYQNPRGDEDVKFRVLTKAVDHPKYRPASREDQKSLPPPDTRHAIWDSMVRK